MIKEFYATKRKRPEGYTVLDDTVEIVGVQHHRDEACSFAENAHKGWLEFEQEPDNSYDKNAIKVIGCYSGFLGIMRRLHIGYVPKEIALILAKNNWECLPHLDKVYMSDKGFVDLSFQLLGPPKTKKIYQEKLYKN